MLVLLTCTAMVWLVRRMVQVRYRSSAFGEQSSRAALLQARAETRYGKRGNWAAVLAGSALTCRRERALGWLLADADMQIIGVSFWASKESCDAWRASEAEARRREAMAPHVLDEQEAFYRSRELVIPAL